MAKTYTPAIFQPTVRPSWAGILSYISEKERSDILEAIIKYPTDTGINSKFWQETIKPDLDEQYTKFLKICDIRGRSAKTYWGEHKLSLSNTYDNHKDNLLKDKDKDKVKDKDKDKSKDIDVKCNEGDKRFGTLKNVLLTEQQYLTLKERHENIDDAIETLDTWLGGYSDVAKKAKGKNHFAYFKSNSWVWERLGEHNSKGTKPLTKAQQIDQHNLEYIKSLYDGEVINA